MKILFVAEQFVPPVYDGSTAVYYAWLKSLNTIGDVYAILFNWNGEPDEKTHSFLSKVCRDYVILPGRNRLRSLKTARAFGRFINGSLFAHPAIEELGRRRVKQAVTEFIDSRKPDIALMSKLECIHLIGFEILKGLRIPKLIDIHDDFVSRENVERETLRQMLKTFPALSHYRYYRIMRWRHALSRHNVVRARRQEEHLLSIFDRILISSKKEYLEYSARRGLAGRCVHLPWPIQSLGTDIEATGNDRDPEFDAGLIASGNPLNLEGLSFFVKEVLPLIRRQRPNFRLLVAGNIDAAITLSGVSMEGLELAGTLDNTASFYGRVGLCLVPLLHGTGVSLKTIEAIGYGLPVVATGMGARGIEHKYFPNLVIADTPEAFAEAVLTILEGVRSEPGNPVLHSSHSSADVSNHLEQFIELCADVGIKARI